MNIHPSRRHHRPAGRRQPPSEAGQSLVEFMAMGIALIILLMGVLDLARAYFTYLALKDAAGEGAYYASAFPQCTDADGVNNDSPACAEPNTVPYRVRNSAPRGGLVDWTDAGAAIGVELPCGGASPCVLEAGQSVTVTVGYNYRMITPIVSALAPNGTLTLTARSSAVIIRVPNCTVTPCR